MWSKVLAHVNNSLYNQSKWLHSKQKLKYGSGWSHRDFFLHAPMLLATYCICILLPFFFFLKIYCLLSHYIHDILAGQSQPLPTAITQIVIQCGGRDRMVVGFTTTYAISVYHHWCCEFEFRSGRGVQHYVIKFVSDLLQVGGFLLVLRFPPPIKLTATI